MNATDELIRLDPALKVEPYGGGLYHSFRQTDVPIVGFPSGIDVEEGEFLYGLVRVCKPWFVLETGTNTAISARYIGLALRDNGFGELDTIEHDTVVHATAAKKIEQSGLSTWVHCICGKVSNYGVYSKLDMLWLDTEPLERYAELLRFFPDVRNGGIICVHDLRWPDTTKVFGEVPQELDALIKQGKLNVVSFWTYRNVTVFQKVSD